MRWQNREKSQNIEDHRRRKVRRRKVGGGIGIGTILIVVLGLILGQDPGEILQQVQQQSSPVQEQYDNRPTSKNENVLADFVAVVLKDTEDVWTKLFRDELGRRYIKPSIVLYSGSDQSACGYAQTATGPFYCPGDQKIYLDLSFYQELKNKFKAPGDFAMAYVVAHEVAHHVQYLLGITDEVQKQRQKSSKVEGNKLSVKMELQADFLAGVWAHHAHKMKHILEEGDLEEALTAASAIGDDRIQKQARGYVVPDSFTHGTSKQRVRWFTKGLRSGDISQGDTFNAKSL